MGTFFGTHPGWRGDLDWDDADDHEILTDVDASPAECLCAFNESDFLPV